MINAVTNGFNAIKSYLHPSEDAKINFQQKIINALNKNSNDGSSFKLYKDLSPSDKNVTEKSWPGPYIEENPMPTWHSLPFGEVYLVQMSSENRPIAKCHLSRLPAGMHADEYLVPSPALKSVEFEDYDYHINALSFSPHITDQEKVNFVKEMIQSVHENDGSVALDHSYDEERSCKYLKSPYLWYYPLITHSDILKKFDVKFDINRMGFIRAIVAPKSNKSQHEPHYLFANFKNKGYLYDVMAESAFGLKHLKAYLEQYPEEKKVISEDPDFFNSMDTILEIYKKNNLPSQLYSFVMGQEIRQLEKSIEEIKALILS